LLVVLEPGGKLDASFGGSDAISVQLGGPSDALFGSTILPGAEGSSPPVTAGRPAGDEAALLGIDLR